MLSLRKASSASKAFFTLGSEIYFSAVLGFSYHSSTDFFNNQLMLSLKMGSFFPSSTNCSHTFVNSIPFLLKKLINGKCSPKVTLAKRKALIARSFNISSSVIVLVSLIDSCNSYMNSPLYEPYPPSIKRYFVFKPYFFLCASSSISAPGSICISPPKICVKPMDRALLYEFK